MKLELNHHEEAVLKAALVSRKLDIEKTLTLETDFSIDTIMFYKKELQTIDILITKMEA
jgi:hypothetical protein